MNKIILKCCVAILFLVGGCNTDKSSDSCCSNIIKDRNAIPAIAEAYDVIQPLLPTGKTYNKAKFQAAITAINTNKNRFLKALYAKKVLDEATKGNKGKPSCDAAKLNKEFEEVLQSLGFQTGNETVANSYANVLKTFTDELA